MEAQPIEMTRGKCGLAFPGVRTEPILPKAQDNQEKPWTTRLSHKEDWDQSQGQLGS